MVATAPPAPQSQTGEPKSLEQILLERKVISEDQINLVKFENLKTGNTIEQIIRDRGFASEQEIIAARAQAQGIEKVEVIGRMISPEVLNLIPRSLAEQYLV